MKTWLQLLNGKPFDLFNPDPALITIEDLAHSLSNLCRWTGRVRTFYSVAEHSCAVADYVRMLGGDNDAVRAALLHDAHEAYTGDVPSPLKEAMRDDFGFSVLDHIQDLVQDAVDKRFGTDSRKHAAIIKRGDEMSLWVERERLLTKSEREWECEPEAPPRELHLALMAPAQAAQSFRRYADLLGLK